MKKSLVIFIVTLLTIGCGNKNKNAHFEDSQIFIQILPSLIDSLDFMNLRVDVDYSHIYILDSVLNPVFTPEELVRFGKRHGLALRDSIFMQRIKEQKPWKLTLANTKFRDSILIAPIPQVLENRNSYCDTLKSVTIGLNGFYVNEKRDEGIFCVDLYFGSKCGPLYFVVINSDNGWHIKRCLFLTAP
jgi:hypothetical protein